MIDEQMRVEYLSPERWNRLGEVIERIRPPRRILYALEGAGCDQVAYDHSGRAVELAPWQRENGSLDGDGLLSAYPEYCEFQLWPEKGVAQWYARVNRACTPRTAIGDYLQTVRDAPCRRFVRQGLPEQLPDWSELLPAPQEDSVQAKLIFREERLYFDALLLWRGGRLTLLTSLDRYPAAAVDATAGAWDFHAICDMIKAEFGVPANVEVLDWNTLR